MSSLSVFRNHPISTAAAIFVLTLLLRRVVKRRSHPFRNAPSTNEPLFRVIDKIFPPKDCPKKKLALYAQNPAYQPLVVSWNTLEGPYLIINDGDVIKEVLVNRQAKYGDTNTMQRSTFRVKITSRLLGCGMFNCTGQEWKWRRDAIVPLFQPRRVLPALLPYLVERLNKMMDELSVYAQSGEAVEMDAQMVDLTFDVISKYLFGLTGEDEIDYTLVGGKENIKPLFDKITSANQVIWINLPIIGQTKWASQGFRPLRDSFESLIRSTSRRSLARPDLYLDRARTIRPVVHELFHYPGYAATNGDEMSQELVSELVGLIFAGHDTTSHTAAFAFGEIATHPEIQRKLFDEVRAAFGDQARVEEEGIKDKLGGLTYLTAVVRETLRMYPIVNGSLAEAKVDQELAGQFIPAGQNVYLNFRGAQMDPRYFPEPFTFDPSRWLASASEVFEEIDSTTDSGKRTLPELAFAVGTHSCLGRNLAMLELRALIAFVVNRYEIALKVGTKLDNIAVLSMMPKGGVWVTLRERM